MMCRCGHPAEMHGPDGCHKMVVNVDDLSAAYTATSTIERCQCTMSGTLAAVDMGDGQSPYRLADVQPRTT